jgi:hypothetical protein
MIRVAITPTAYAAIAATLALGTVAVEPECAQNGSVHIWLVKVGELEIPSDWRGVIDEPFDSGGAWRQTLARELNAAGYDIDWNKVMRFGSHVLCRPWRGHTAGAPRAFCPVGSLGAALDQRVQRRGDASRLMTRPVARQTKPRRANVGAFGAGEDAVAARHQAKNDL